MSSFDLAGGFLSALLGMVAQFDNFTGPIPKGTELVMSEGMIIEATTKSGSIKITAGPRTKRTYTWEGASRFVWMIPRGERWYGSMGMYNPGPGDHWKKHNGISRAVVEEGQQHFKTVDEALKWIKEHSWQPTVYRNDGLVVLFGKVLDRRQLNVDVWQILINGKKPKKLPGASDSAIKVTLPKKK